MKRLAVVILAMLMVLACLGGCKLTSEKVFEKDGLQITLPAYFQDLSNQDYAEGISFLYGFGSLAVMGIKEQKAGPDEYIKQLTLENYGQLIISANNLTCELTQKDGLYTFVYEAESQGTKYTYLSAVFESETDFWTVQCYCTTDSYAKNYDTMWKYLKSVIV